MRLSFITFHVNRLILMAGVKARR